jgi:hypothetical protein
LPPLQRGFLLTIFLNRYKIEKQFNLKQIRRMMRRIFKKSSSFSEAERWDIEQHVGMSPRERQKAARILKRRVFGTSCRDIRDAHKKK